MREREGQKRAVRNAKLSVDGRDEAQPRLVEKVHHF